MVLDDEILEEEDNNPNMAFGCIGEVDERRVEWTREAWGRQFREQPVDLVTSDTPRTSTIMCQNGGKVEKCGRVFVCVLEEKTNKDGV